MQRDWTEKQQFFFRWCLLVASQTRICVRMDSGYENHRQTKLNSTTADFQFAFLFMPRALVCAQAFPPLLKQAGGHRFCSLSGTGQNVFRWLTAPPSGTARSKWFNATYSALRQAGGVAKDYLALCRALIDGLGWEVTLFSPVNIRESGEEDVTIPRCTMMKNFVSAVFVLTSFRRSVSFQEEESAIMVQCVLFSTIWVNFYWQ